MRLASLATHVPSLRLPVPQLAEMSGCSPMEAKVFSRLLGIDSISAHSNQETPLHAMQTVIRSALSRLDNETIDTLIYVHAYPIQSADTQNRLTDLVETMPELQSVRHCYEVDQHNCAGGFWALSTARTLLNHSPAERILILIGDSFFSLSPEHRYVAGCTMMADGYAALVVDRSNGPWQIDRIYTHHDSMHYHGLFGDHQQNQAFYRAHDSLVNDALDALDDPENPYSAILPHNINRVSWSNYTKAFPDIGERLDLTLLPEIGHCCAADPFLLMAHHFQHHDNKKKRWALLSVGSGGYVGACSVTYTHEQ